MSDLSLFTRYYVKSLIVFILFAAYKPIKGVIVLFTFYRSFRPRGNKKHAQILISYYELGSVMSAGDTKVTRQKWPLSLENLQSSEGGRYEIFSNK